MKAKELRIGNYYMCAGNHEIVVRKVKVIQLNKFGFLSDIDGTNYEICKPVILTKEWLDKFNWNGYNSLHFNSNFEIDKQGRLYCSGNYKGVNINYVHQLQNLYFALTGGELTIKK